MSEEAARKRIIAIDSSKLSPEELRELTDFLKKTGKVSFAMEELPENIRKIIEKSMCQTK